MNKEKLLNNRYENKRKELINYQLKSIEFMNKTYTLLKLLGLTDKEIFEYYERGYKWQKEECLQNQSY